MATRNQPRKRFGAGTRAIVLTAALVPVTILIGAAPARAATEGEQPVTQNICTLLPYWPGCPRPLT